MDIKYSDYKRQHTLFHYTNADSLRGILQTNSLWATAYHCANDLSEFTYALDIIELKMKELVRHKSINLNPLLCLATGLAPIDDYKNAIKRYDFIGFMITSFSYAKNRLIYKDGQLNQYRNYGDYAICFNRKRLEKSVKKHMFEKFYIQSSKVTYGPRNNKRLLDFSKKYLEPFLKNYRNRVKFGTYNLDNLYEPTTREVIDFIEMAAFTKNPHFNEENEFRLSVSIVDSSECKFTNRNGLIIPYVELDFDIIPCINRIIIGPSPRSDDRVRSVKALVESCIKKHKLDVNIEVTKSNIPYNRE